MSSDEALTAESVVEWVREREKANGPGVSVGQILKGLGISRSRLYSFFPGGKEEILRAACLPLSSYDKRMMEQTQNARLARSRGAAARTPAEGGEEPGRSRDNLVRYRLTPEETASLQALCFLTGVPADDLIAMWLNFGRELVEDPGLCETVVEVSRLVRQLREAGEEPWKLLEELLAAARLGLTVSEVEMVLGYLGKAEEKGISRKDLLDRSSLLLNLGVVSEARLTERWLKVSKAAEKEGLDVATYIGREVERLEKARSEWREAVGEREKVREEAQRIVEEAKGLRDRCIRLVKLNHSLTCQLVASVYMSRDEELRSILESAYSMSLEELLSRRLDGSRVSGEVDGFDSCIRQLEERIKRRQRGLEEKAIG